MLEQLDPKAKSTNLDRIIVDIYAEQAILNDPLFLVKYGLLNSLALFAFWSVMEKITVISRNQQFVIHNFKFVS
jgi:hypothetical protein